MKSLKLLLLGVLITGISFNLKGEGKNSPQIFKYNDYINAVISTLPEIKSNGINVLLQSNANQNAKSVSDLTLNGGVKYSSNKQYVMVPVLMNGKTETTDIYAQLSQNITATGTKLTLSTDYAKTQYKNFGASSLSTYNPSVSLTLKQPLLYNFLGKVDRFSEKNEEMKLDIEKIKSLENNKMILTSYKKFYFQYLFYQISILNLEDAIRNTKILKNQVAKNLKYGLSDDDDYQGATASVLNYEQQMQDYLTILKNLEKQIEITLAPQKILPHEKEFEKYLEISLKTKYENISFEKTNSFKIIDLSVKRLLYAKGIFENKTLPELNLVASATQKNTSTEKPSSLNLPDTDYYIGLEFSYKFGNSEAKSNLENINLQIQSLKYEYEAAINGYKKNLSKILEYSEGLKNTLDKKIQYLKALNMKLSAETKKYRQGRLKLSYLIDTENAIANAKTEIANLKYQLISIYIDYFDLIQ